MSQEFASGFYYNEPHENAPDFILASMSVRPDVFIEWLKEQKTNEHGYVRMTAKRGKEGKPYVVLDTWVKTQQSAPRQATEDIEYPEEEINPDDIPF